MYLFNYLEGERPLFKASHKKITIKDIIDYKRSSFLLTLNRISIISPGDVDRIIPQHLLSLEESKFRMETKAP